MPQTPLGLASAALVGAATPLLEPPFFKLTGLESLYPRLKNRYVASARGTHWSYCV